jgi:hypothetical protein
MSSRQVGGDHYVLIALTVQKLESYSSKHLGEHCEISKIDGEVRSNECASTVENQYHSKPRETSPALPMPKNAALRVTQTAKSFARADAPYESEIVIESDQTFTSLKFAMQCDGPLVDVESVSGGVGFSR